MHLVQELDNHRYIDWFNNLIFCGQEKIRYDWGNTISVRWNARVVTSNSARMHSFKYILSTTAATTGFSFLLFPYCRSWAWLELEKCPTVFLHLAIIPFTPGPSKAITAVSSMRWSTHPNPIIWHKISSSVIRGFVICNATNLSLSCGIPNFINFDIVPSQKGDYI